MSEGLYARAHDKIIRDFLPVMDGQDFTAHDIWQRFGLQNKPEHTQYKKAIDDVLWNLTHKNKKPTLKQVGKRYKRINRDVQEIKWWEAMEKKPVVFNWPRDPDTDESFGLGESVILYPGDGIVIAGEGNRGKTAWALNLLIENLDNFNCTYVSSEFNDLKFRDRISKFDWAELYRNGRPKFELLPMTADYEDIVDDRPDNLIIFDWLKLDDEAYKMRGVISRILKPLNNGIAVIILQKRSYKTAGEGGEGTIDMASVYLTISKERLKVEKVKTPGTFDPNYKMYGFEIFNHGSKFGNIREVKTCQACHGRSSGFGYDCKVCYGKGYVEK